MSPVPKLNTDGIFDKLSTFHARKQSNSFLLKQDRREAEKLIPKHPARAYAILGAIACLENNLPQMHQYHKISIENACHDYEAVSNYMTSLEKCGLWKDCLEVGLSEYDNNKSDIALLLHTIEAAERAGYYHKAFELIEQYNKLNIDEPYKGMGLVIGITDIMNKHNIVDADFERVISLSTSAISERGFILKSYNTGITKQDGAFIRKEFRLFDDIDLDLFEIEDEIDSILINKVPSRILEGISVSIYNPIIADFIDIMDRNISANFGDLIDPDEKDTAFLMDLMDRVEIE